MATWEEYLREAGRFWEVARAFDDPDHPNQAAGNAVLTLIAANDAVCLRLLQRRAKGGSHAEAAQLLRKACQGTPWERDAAQKSEQFLQVIRKKNAAHYEGRALSAAEVRVIMKQVERFLEWARNVLGGE
jgi:hypothetical protein